MSEREEREKGGDARLAGGGARSSQHYFYLPHTHTYTLNYYFPLPEWLLMPSIVSES